MSVGIVTGAARGMGAACAARVADMVDVLLAVDRDERSLTEAAAALSASGVMSKVEPFPVDVKDRDGLVRLAARAARARPAACRGARGRRLTDHGRLARGLDGRPGGHGPTSWTPCGPWPPTEPPSSVLRRSRRHLPCPTSTNPPTRRSTTRSTPEFLERLRESVGPALEDSGMAYTWAKRGVHRLVRREAVPFGRLGARICSVTPGIIDTPMGRQEADTHAVMEMLVQASALGREGRPEEVAAAVAFLLSDDARLRDGG